MSIGPVTPDPSAARMLQKLQRQDGANQAPKTPEAEGKENRQGEGDASETQRQARQDRAAVREGTEAGEVDRGLQEAQRGRENESEDAEGGIDVYA